MDAYKNPAAETLEHWRDASDAGAEFQLRDQEPPFANEIEALQAAVLKGVEENPALREMFEQELERELKSIIRMLIDPKAKN